jgi:predicted  nucleic acid-binding Zn-ribbon protein
LSTVQKAFAFIVLVLAVLTAAVGLVNYAQKTNWKERSATLDKDLSAARAAQAAMEKTKDAEIQARQSRVLELEGQFAALDTQKKDIEATLEATRADKAALEALASDLKAKTDLIEKTLAALTDETAQLRTQKETAEKGLEQVRTEAQGYQERAAMAERQVKDLTAKGDTLAEQVAEREERIKQLEQRINVLSAYAPAGTAAETQAASRPNIFGRVSRVTDDGQRVFLSIGEDDGVTTGMEFLIYRGKAYIATARVFDVGADQSQARVVPPVVGTIMEGDNVAVK